MPWGGRAILPRMPLSEKRLAANRANALKSTGPKTEHGKRMSAQNGSNRTRLANVVLLTQRIARQLLHTSPNPSEEMFHPQDPFEESLVENMVVARWRTIRLWNLESANLNHAVARLCETGIQENKATTAALAMQNLPDGGRTQERFSRYEARYDRQYHRAVIQLARYRAEKRRMKNPEQGEPIHLPQNQRESL